MRKSCAFVAAIAKLPLAKDIDDFQFDNTPVNKTLVRDLARGAFLAQQRNVVLIGGTGTGKTHLAIAVARACIRDGARGRFFNVVDLVNKLEAEPLDEALAWIERYRRQAEERYQRLDALLADLPDETDGDQA